jgi:hypothetical protein
MWLLPLSATRRPRIASCDRHSRRIPLRLALCGAFLTLGYFIGGDDDGVYFGVFFEGRHVMTGCCDAADPPDVHVMSWKRGLGRRCCSTTAPCWGDARSRRGPRMPSHDSAAGGGGNGVAAALLRRSSCGRLGPQIEVPQLR